ncbi:MAG: hypothetical protein MUP09_07685 [Thiovulaceae bacterium]|nr:hypothetical protein [Sulfurimonadaceae bacterium]
MTHSELKRYNGRNGMKAYVAYKGTVYNVTESSFWVEGQHSAGGDLTAMLAGAPHGNEVFEKMAVVGTLEEALGTSYKTGLQILYKKYHPYPMAAHFPIALHLFAAGLNILFLASPKDAYDIGAAMQKALETKWMLLGVFYKNISSTFEQRIRHGETGPLYATRHDLSQIQGLFDRY